MLCSRGFFTQRPAASKSPRLSLSDVDEFVTTHKLNVLEAHTFLLVSHTCTFHFYCTQRNQTPSYFLGQQRHQANRATTPSGQQVTAFIPTIGRDHPSVRAREGVVRAWARAICVSTRRSSPLARHASLLQVPQHDPRRLLSST